MPSIVVGNDQLTLSDYQDRIAPDGSPIMPIIEMMSRMNSIIEDALFVESNAPNGHLVAQRTGLPAIAWRAVNKGVPQSKSTVKQLLMTPGVLEGQGVIDEELVDQVISGNTFRASELPAFLEAFSQTLANTMFYGDVRVYPSRFTGLSAYFANLNTSYQQNPDLLVNPSGTLPDSGRNVFDASSNYSGETFGTPSNGNNTSMWLVCWSNQALHTFFPRGSFAGIFHEDKAKWRVDDGTGTNSTYFAYVDQYKARMGLAVADWRQAVRICNIDAIALASAGDDNDISANLVKNGIQAANYLQFPEMGRTYWYCNRYLKTYLEVKAMHNPNNFLNYEIEDGMRITKFMGHELRRCDALLNAESQVS